ncbi:MAG: carboxylating nicotinate-nucleotide diphosphorylase [Proteobacteria bacterium]|nr:carboxylating nicotinate-nucleotide diphosphorylase [Pseudomonadota bacterium]
MFEIKKIITMALEEDIGTGDVTSEALLMKKQVASGKIVAKEAFVLAGIEIAREVFETVNPCTIFRASKKDGDKIKEGTVLAEMTGNVVDLLVAERTALNFIQRLSGISTITAAFVGKVRGRATIVDTRKTIPGLRSLEKYAVKIGGGNNHRVGLFDGILIKDNHIAACGGITEAVTRAQKNAPHTLKVEVEVSSMDEVQEALDCGANIIMLDNMDVEKMREAVKLIGEQALIEASGNVSLDNVDDIALTGVDFISVGALTHSAPAVDISMKIEGN